MQHVYKSWEIFWSVIELTFSLKYEQNEILKHLRLTGEMSIDILRMKFFKSNDRSNMLD